MQKIYNFDSKFDYVGDFKSEWSQEIVKNEPMLFNCNLESAYKLGGPITKAFLDSIQNLEGWENIVVDSRVHMLMKGWFPAIPGYHHDDVPRDSDGQPDYDRPTYKSEHIMGLVNGSICPTVFAVGKHTLPKIYKPEIVYKKWHTIVEDQIESGVLNTVEVESGKLIYFNTESIHTAQRAKSSGWRWFIRVSKNTERTKNCTNELRRQVQVYLEFPMEGW